MGRSIQVTSCRLMHRSSTVAPVRFRPAESNRGSPDSLRLQDQLSGDVGAGQADGAGGGEPLVQERVAVDLQGVGDQAVAVLVGAGELGAG